MGLLGLPLRGLLGGVKPDIGRLGVAFWYDGGVPGVGGAEPFQRCKILTVHDLHNVMKESLAELNII